jgi:hypothetical protein
MNALSWFLLLLDFYENFQFFSLTAFWLLIFICVSRVVIGLALYGDHYPDGDEENHYWSTRNRRSKKWFDEKRWMPHWTAIVGIALFSFIAFLTPSKDTLYLVASSEAAEMVVASENGKQVLQDLKEVLHAQLEALKTPVK